VKIKQACLDPGFVFRGAKAGNGFATDCTIPIIQDSRHAPAGYRHHSSAPHRSPDRDRLQDQESEVRATGAGWRGQLCINSSQLTNSGQ